MVSETGCWEWTAGRTKGGYGKFLLDGSYINAHRAAYLLLVGPVPDGTHIDHLCRNRACVNPAHLEAVSPRENTVRGGGPTALNARKTHCVNGHEFTPENTNIRPKGGRECRACSREKQARIRADARAHRQSIGDHA